MGIIGTWSIPALWLCRVAAQSITDHPSRPAGAVEVATISTTPSAPDAEAIGSQYQAELSRVDGTNHEAAAATVSTCLDQLLAGKFPAALQLELLEAAEKHNNPTVKEKLERFNNGRLNQGGMATQSELLYGGDAARGRKIFFENPAAQCFKCHRIGFEGGDTGPPLTGVGSRLKREELLESLLFPDAKIAPGYETVLVKLKDRSGRSGVLKLETETELTLDCPPDGRITLKKSDIVLRRAGGSVMPDGFEETLTKRQLRDLVEFLAELK